MNLTTINVHPLYNSHKTGAIKPIFLHRTIIISSPLYLYCSRLFTTILYNQCNVLIYNKIRQSLNLSCTWIIWSFLQFQCHLLHRNQQRQRFVSHVSCTVWQSTTPLQMFATSANVNPQKVNICRFQVLR